MDLKADPEKAFNHSQDPEHASVIRQLTRDFLNYCGFEKDPYGQILAIQEAMKATSRLKGSWLLRFNSNLRKTIEYPCSLSSRLVC